MGLTDYSRGSLKSYMSGLGQMSGTVGLFGHSSSLFFSWTFSNVLLLVSSSSFGLFRTDEVLYMYLFEIETLYAHIVTSMYDLIF